MREEGSRKTDVRFARMPGCLAASDSLRSCNLSSTSAPAMGMRAISCHHVTQSNSDQANQVSLAAVQPQGCAVRDSSHTVWSADKGQLFETSPCMHAR